MFRHLFRWSSIALLSALSLLALTPVALADGGAPNLAYVAGGGNGISVVDVAQQQATNAFTIPGDPHMILLSLDGRFLYITQPQLGRVEIVAAKTGDTICSVNLPGQPSLLALDSNTNTFFAAGNGADKVTALDTTNCNVKHTYTVSGHVYGLAIANLGTSLASGTTNQLWVSDDSTLKIFDETKGTLLRTIPVTGGPQYLSIPPGSSVYTTTRDGNVFVVDLATYKLTKLYTGGSFGPMDFDETTGQVYLPDRQN